MDYQLTQNGSILRTADGALIPASTDNRDYQAYLDWVNAGNTPDPAPVEALADVVAGLADQIDSYVALVYSSWTRFQAEYEAREAAATAFTNAGYAGDPGTWVSSYATAAGVTNTQAAQTILAQSTQLNGALAAIGAQRMRKYDVLSAPDAATARSTYQNIIAAIQAIAAQLS